MSSEARSPDSIVFATLAFFGAFGADVADLSGPALAFAEGLVQFKYNFASAAARAGRAADRPGARVLGGIAELIELVSS